MPDTQWPRFMVFVQGRESVPWRHAGTVHAPDAAMALLNARDVFARRPQALGMWVVPVDMIFSKTQEELENPERAEAEEAALKEKYLVFGKPFEQAACELIGELEAQSPTGAMKSALKTYSEKKPLWWWVFPASSVLASENDDSDPMFIPAKEKTYKNQSEYHTCWIHQDLNKVA